MKVDPATLKFGSNLRVLHVLHGLHAGGMENGVINLAHGQLPQGISHDVCSLTNAGSFAQRLPGSSRVELLHKPEGFSFKTCLKLRSLIKRFRPDIVHSHNYSGLIYSTLALTNVGIPLLAGEHAQLTDSEKAPRRRLIRRWLYRFGCKLIHTVSEGQRIELLQLNLAPPEAVITLSNGVDTQRFQPHDGDMAKSALDVDLPPGSVLVGMVARLAHHKRHDRLLQAFEKLAAQHPKLHLALVGDRGNAKESILNTIAAHPFQKRIHWLGMRDNLPEVYPAFDLLVLPSESEGMSNVCLEAMACGVPVAANDSCGATEIIIDGVTGIIRPMPDAEAIEAHLKSCLATPAMLSAWGQNARQHIEQNFSIASMMNRYEKVYRSLLRK